MRLIIILIILFLTTNITALAIEGRNGGNGDRDEIRIEQRREERIERDDDRVRIRIRQEIRRREEENEVEVRERFEQRVEIRGNEFEIRGEITKIEKDNFVVASQTIFVDPNLVGEFEQKGTLKVGKKVEVKGVIIDGKNFARGIKVFEDNEEIEIEVKNVPEAKVEIKARGLVEQLNELLDRLLRLLGFRS